MVRLSVIFLIFHISSLASADGDVRLYRTEDDFRRGIELPERKVGWKSYLEVRFDYDGNVVGKYYFVRKNKLDRFERFEYDTTLGVLNQISVFSADSTLVTYTQFGAQEKMSEKFIRHTYGVRRIQDFDDRFTSVEYLADGKPKVYRFFDVNRFLYGVIEMNYDDNGRLRQEDWISMPAERVVKRYVKDYDAESGTTDVWEYDSTLTLINHMTVAADGRAPVITVIYPEDSLAVNSPTLSYSLKEGVINATIRWDWVGGKTDTVAPYVMPLIFEESTRGEHLTVSPRNAPTLLDSAIYRVTFSGEGESGYQAADIVLNSVPFDTTPPTYTVDADLFVSHPRISYVLDESLAEAEVLWVWERGMRDADVPYVVGLSAGILKAGKHEEISFGEDVQLKEGTVYGILFQGKDIAGNPGPFLTVSGVSYDTTAPVIAWQLPDSGGFVNSSVVSYTLSEELYSGETVWRHVGGEPDSLAPHHVKLEGEEKHEGKHQYIQLVNAPPLADGAVYDITVHGVDLAGNLSDTVNIARVAHDRRPPKVAVLLPLAESAVRQGEVIYSFTEEMASAELEWYEIGKEALDTAHVNLRLAEENLSSGDHRLDDPQMQLSLRDGARYIVRLTARDLAGNEATPVEVDNVEFDITPPAFSQIVPGDSSFIASDAVTYHLSEDIIQGAVMWTQVSGDLDPDSPYMVELSADGMNMGVHKSVSPPEALPLKEGSVYEVTFMGLDRAGNPSRGTVSRQIIYDVTPPQIQLAYPQSRGHVSTAQISYSISELLNKATATWTRTGGEIDDNAPHTAHFAADELQAGSHDSLLLAQAPELVSGAIYSVTLEGTDLSGKQSSPVVAEGVRYDDVPPVMNLASPLAATEVNSAGVRYSVDEPLKSASMIWTRQDGKEDPSSPHAVELIGTELAVGDHGDSALVNAPFLVDGATYDIQFIGQDSAGNSSDTVMVTEIVFDNTPPRFEMTYPVAAMPVRNFDVGFIVSEQLNEGSVVWERSAGSEDEVGTHTQILTDGELNSGEHATAALVSPPPSLVEGAVYSVYLKGRDRAGNESISTPLQGILFDATAPVFSDVKPSSNGFMNSSALSYNLSENIDEGSIVWRHVGGAEDARSPHVAQLTGDELLGGRHDAVVLQQTPSLQDGAVYTISFVGQDAAQNISDTLVVENVFYDVIAPVIEVAWPKIEIYVADSHVSYSVSEDLGEGSITWEQVRGTLDKNSPHVQSLVDEELKAGEHFEVELTAAPQLSEGTTYTITFSGKDHAGNEADSVTIADVTFDATAPFISDVTPASGSFINDPKVSYWISENMLEGTFIWTRIGGTEDPNTPHISSLGGIELQSGTFPESRLEESPILVDGAVYTLRIGGSDVAGNIADTVRIDSITYDVTSPVFAVISPEPNSFISSAAQSYSLSEDIIEGAVTWERSGGGFDGKSPHSSRLSGDQLTAGEHEELAVSEMPSLSDGTIYSLAYQGIDRAGNRSEPTVIQGISYDVTPPAISGLSPSDSSYVNHTRISYELSEIIAEGSVIWTRIAGETDPRSPHVVTLAEGERGGGAHTDLTLTDALILKDGSVYRISVEGVDAAGNRSDTVSVSEVSYDVRVPEFQVEFPATGAFIADSRIAYSLEEVLTSGTVTWIRSAGNPDPDSPHELVMLDQELVDGPHDGQLAAVPELVDGAIYTIQFNGRDRAGNSAETIEITGVKFDATPPVIALASPAADETVNHNRVTYSLSEELAEGTVTWKQSGGTADANSPHEIPLFKGEIAVGDHADITLEYAPTLSDGSIYTITVVGKDFAGNVSDTVSIENIAYDTTPPVFAVTAPVHGDFIGAPMVTYSLSESIKEGKITWKWESGTQDTGTPHTSILSLNELEMGDHQEWTLTDAPELVSGALYSVTFSGLDFAGNSSEDIVIENVTFDKEPPVISAISPEDNSFIDNTRLSYSLSEALVWGAVTWTRVDGSLDQAAPHIIELIEEEMTQGEHLDIALSHPFTLQDGAGYLVEFRGRDRAGNEAEAVTIADVRFDVAPPVYTVSFPTSDSYIREPIFSFDVNENLKEATVTWARTGGEADPGAPHPISLSGPELVAGSHLDVSPAEAVNLVNDAVYSLSFKATDLAGNTGEAVTVTSLTFDDIAPVLTVASPEAVSFTNSVRVSYTNSEPLASGTVTWTQIGGTADGGSPHEIALTGDELLAGEHADIELASAPSLQDGAVYDVAFQGIDPAGNEAEGVLISEISYDVTNPVITLSSPSAGEAVNYLTVSYELSEELKSGAFTWMRTAGAEDPASPHRSKLSLEERQAGSRVDVMLAKAAKLMDGSVYSVMLSGEDKAGNAADSVLVDNVIFDVTPPVIVANSPAPSGIVSTSALSYSLSEPLAEGTVRWTRTGGAEDSGSPHEVLLSGNELEAGDHQQITLSPAPVLMSGAVYSISFDGKDAAQNKASGMAIESVTFDSEKPVFTLEIPGGKTAIREPRLSYTFSEKLASGTLTWTRESGSDDPGSPHTIELSGDELTSGDHSDVLLSNAPVLADGASYTIEISGADMAGNEGTSVAVTGIFYDVTPPVASLELPAAESILNELLVSYSLSETLAEGKVTWTQTAGNTDSQSPHEVLLTDLELAQGDHPTIALANQNPLTDGAVYKLTLSGVDFAGNQTADVTVAMITYDVTPPQFTEVSPTSGSFVNNEIISYTLSEALSKGTAVWRQSGGASDPNSPHTVELTADELTSGPHEAFVLANMTELVSGATYMLTFSGSDMAGNESDGAETGPISYDAVPPVFTISGPGNSDWVNHTRVSYELSEALESGSISWTPKDGGASLVQSLSGGELEGGSHLDIQLASAPSLEDGKVYDIVFEGTDPAGNPAEEVLITDVTYDITAPKIKIDLSRASPAKQTVVYMDPFGLTNSEEMSEITFTWSREAGSEDPESPHELKVSPENLTEGDHAEVVPPGSDKVLIGTVYTLAIQGKDIAGNESKRQTVQSIDIIRLLEGNWLWKGAILTAVWSFTGDKGFAQGVLMGTSIAEQEPGEYAVNFGERPFELLLKYDSGIKRYALFEFIGHNKMRVVSGERKPKSWTDGDLMEFEYSEEDIP